MGTEAAEQPLSSLLEAFKKKRIEWYLQVPHLEQRLGQAECLLREHQSAIQSLRDTILPQQRLTSSGPSVLVLQNVSFLEQLD